MGVPQLTYIFAVCVYMLFFFLFMRMFVWKYYADRKFWRCKPRLTQETLLRMSSDSGRSLPFISVMVPARNEADVISRTIDHLSRLNYPKDMYEIIVVTDEKELMARESEREALIDAACELLRLETPHKARKHGRKVKNLAIGVLTYLCFREFGRSDWRKENILSISLPEGSREEQHQGIVRELALELSGMNGMTTSEKLRAVMRRLMPNLSEQELGKALPIYLSLAIPVACAFSRLTDDSSGQISTAFAKSVTKARHAVTRDVLRAFIEIASGRILVRLAALRRGDRLDRLVAELYNVCFPTTQDMVEDRLSQFSTSSDVPALRHVVVPYDFDGFYRGRLTGSEVPSTKGRALNWGLSFVDPKSEICGFYDAESRPDPDVLLYVAYRRLKDGDAVKILQGPVFQVRNFYVMGPLCKIASLYQAIAHDWYLPALFHRLPFVGGTNLFVERALLERIGGYDHSALTEDLELGVRAYFESGAWPEYLPYYSSEQTPPTYRAYFRQRLRWATGHLQVMEKVRREKNYPVDRKRPILRQLFLKGQFEWALYQSATFVPPTVMILWWNDLIDPYCLPEWLRWLLNVFTVIYFSFTVYAYKRYQPYLDPATKPRDILGKLVMWVQFLFLPLAAFAFPVPFSSALVLKALNKQPKSWTKTPRTRE